MSNSSNTFSIQGTIVNPLKRVQYGAELVIHDGSIHEIKPLAEEVGPFIIPGFIDAHVHIESSMLIPSRFADMAVAQGTVAVVADPHEVANVAGIDGINFMLDDASKAKLKTFFGVPSCVPASPLEVCAETITSAKVEKLLADNRFLFLAEMMNFPGVLAADPEVIRKLDAAKRNSKPIDGHAPGLSGNDLNTYVGAGITTDHECTTIQEAIEKIQKGMKILIREGSAARNLYTLAPLLGSYPNHVMLCTDDCHPHHLNHGHINSMVARAVGMGYDIYDVLLAASVNPVTHYKLPVGTLNVGDPADFILVSNLKDFKVESTYINGVNVYKRDQADPIRPNSTPPSFKFRHGTPLDIQLLAQTDRMNTIKAIDGDLITEWTVENVGVTIGTPVTPQIDKDFLKIVLLNRYAQSEPAIAFIKGFGLKHGAIATSVAHDSHHIIAIGCDDQSLTNALQWVIENRGGLCFSSNAITQGLALPFFGLMTDDYGKDVADNYSRITQLLIDAGSTLKDPFMTASFMALTVIPQLKINHNGLFDTSTFSSVPLFVQ